MLKPEKTNNMSRGTIAACAMLRLKHDEFWSSKAGNLKKMSNVSDKSWKPAVTVSVMVSLSVSVSVHDMSCQMLLS